MTPKFSSMAWFADYDYVAAELAKCEDKFFKPYTFAEFANYLGTHFGQIVLARAYADWRNPALRHRGQDLQRGNVQMINVIAGKESQSVVAGNITIDILETLEKYPEISNYAIASRDASLVPLLAKLRAAGKRVAIVAIENAFNQQLVRCADEFISICERGFSQKSPDNMDKNNAINILKNMLSNDGVNLETAEKQLLEEIPDFTPADYGCKNFQEFVQNVAGHAMRIVDNENGQVLVAGSGRNASAFSDDELAKFSLEDYMKATRWYILDGDIRDRVLHNIYTLFEENGRTLSNEELRNLVDPDRIVEDKPWHGTIFSLVYGACLWENPDSSGQHLPNRRLSLFRTVKDEDDFLIRYYTSLFHKAYTDRPGITPRDCAALMHPTAVEEHLPIYERVFEELAKRK